MTDPRRTSRADRRRVSLTRPPGEERRKLPSTTAVVYCQVRNSELQLFVQTPLTADNCASARDILVKHCASAQTPTVVIDLQKTPYIDTVGLSVVFELKKDMANQNRVLIVQNPSRCVLRMLNITRMVRIFKIRTTSQDLEVIPHSKAVPAEPARVPASDSVVKD